MKVAMLLLPLYMKGRDHIQSGHIMIASTMAISGGLSHWFLYLGPSVYATMEALNRIHRCVTWYNELIPL